MNTKPRILYIGNKQSGNGRTPTSIDTLGRLLELQGYQLYYASSYLHKLPKMLDMMFSIIRLRRKADVVLIDTYSTAAFYFAWCCALLCRILRIAYIPVLHGGNLPRRFENSPVMCRQILAHSHTNICVSGYLYGHLQKNGYTGTIIENSIELDNYIYLQRENLQPKLLWVRAFHHTYDPAMAIEVLHKLHAVFPHASLTMVGPQLDDTFLHCRQMVHQYKLEHAVRFTGKLSKEQWRALAAEHDIFINTARFDNQPVTVLEAMALGLPVVSTNVGGIPFIIQQGNNGFLASTADEMCDAIVHLLKTHGTVLQITRNALATAQQYDWTVISPKWDRVLNSIH